MAYAAKNTLFVRNLSPDVSEKVLREVFGECDEIEKVSFRPYNTLSNQFFAQIDFESSKGVAEGSKLSGSNILGVPCVCGVIDPLVAMTKETLEDPLANDPEAWEREFQRRQLEAAEDQKFRTALIKNVGHDLSYEMVRSICTTFGEVEKLRVDEDENGERFALCEFKERGPAHVCKMQQQYFVKGRVLSFLEAEGFVDECGFAEKTVQFEDPMLNAIAIRSVLGGTMQGQLSEKLALVRAAAEEINPLKAKLDAKEMKKKAKKDRKEREREEKKKKKQNKEEKLGKHAKRKKQDGAGSEREEEHAKVKKRHKASRRDASTSRSRPAGRAELVDDESDGPIDLDEVEVVENTELVVMGSSPSSSSSSTDASDDEGRGAPRGAPRLAPRGAPRQVQIDLDGSDVVNLDGDVQERERRAPSGSRSRSRSGSSLS